MGTPEGGRVCYEGEGYVMRWLWAGEGYVIMGRGGVCDKGEGSGGESTCLEEGDT